MKKITFSLLFLITVVIILMQFFTPAANFEKEATDIISSQRARLYHLNTFDDNISSKDIIKLINLCNDSLMKTPPSIYYWEDQMGYPGLSLVWKQEDYSTVVTAFNANDNDSITIHKHKGTFTHKPGTQNISECDISAIRRVINENRIL